MIHHCRTCKKIHISDNLHEIFDIGNVQEASSKLLLTKDQLVYTIQVYEDVKKALAKEKEKVIKNMLEYRKAMELLLVNLEKATVSNLIAKSEMIEAEFRENAKAAKNHLPTIDKYKRQLKLQDLSNSQKFVNLKCAESVLTDSRHASEKCIKPPVESIHFEPNSKLRLLLQDIDQLGMFNFFPYALAPYTIADKYETMNRSTPYTSLVCFPKLKPDVKIRECEDTIAITGTSIAPDGTVLLVDNHNQKLKRLKTPSYDVLDCLDFSLEPWEVHAMNNDEAFVSMNQTIMFVSLGTRMQSIRTLDFDHNCIHLAHHEKKIFVSGSDFIIYIYTTKGYLLSTLSLDLTSCIEGMCVSGDGNMIYIIDDNSGLLAVDVHGVVGWYCDETELGLGCGSGICTDGFRNVLVCGRSRDESPDMVSIVRESGVKSGRPSTWYEFCMPSSISFDSNRLTLIIANNSGQELVIHDVN